MTGWNRDIWESTVVDDPCRIFLAIRLTTEPPAVRQFYAVLDDEVVLVRLENEAGAHVPNVYEFANATIGPPMPTRTARQWEDALASERPVEVLRSLVWLAGMHRVNRDVLAGGAIETRESVDLVSALRRSPSVRDALNSLSKSTHPWIREVAQDAVVRAH